MKASAAELYGGLGPVFGGFGVLLAGCASKDGQGLRRHRAAMEAVSESTRSADDWDDGGGDPDSAGSG